MSFYKPLFPLSGNSVLVNVSGGSSNSQSSSGTTGPTPTVTSTPEATPSGTTTPTPTSTVTPTSTSCVCTTYNINNTGGSLANYSYTDCGGNSVSSTLEGNNNTNICACSIGQIDLDIVVTNLGTPCTTPTPTPTLTPSNTTPPPTPSITPSQSVFEFLGVGFDIVEPNVACSLSGETLYSTKLWSNLVIGNRLYTNNTLTIAVSVGGFYAYDDGISKTYFEVNDTGNITNGPQLCTG